MKLAIVTACPNGMVTSVLCARLLEAAAQRQGWSTSVEINRCGAPRAANVSGHDRNGRVGVVGHQRSGGHVAVRWQARLPEHSGPGPARCRISAAPRGRRSPGLSSRLTPCLRRLQAEKKAPRLVAVTACPTGVAHTFMAAEALQQAAKRLGYDLQVETQGSVGARNPLSAQAIAEADVVLLAADIEVATERFAGKKIYRCGTGIALKQAEATLNKALAEGTQESAATGAKGPARQEKTGVYKHLLTGVSFMLPMVVAGGLMIALSFVFGITAFKEEGTLAAALMQIGGDTAFKLMVPLLAGYIAYSIADRPGLAPGMIGGLLASTLGAGFIGGIIAGFIAGYAAQAINRYARLPQSLEALKPILIIPLLASLFTGSGNDLRGRQTGGGHARGADAFPRQHGHHQRDSARRAAGRNDVRRPRRADQQGRVCVLGGAAGVAELCTDGRDHGRRHGAADWPGNRHVHRPAQIRPNRARSR
jgi:PTS system fructose-specific IIC component